MVTVWLKDDVLSVVEVFAQQVLDDNFDTDGKKNVQYLEKALGTALHGFIARRYREISYAPCRFCMIQSFSTHFTHFLPNRCKVPLLYDRARCFRLHSFLKNNVEDLTRRT